MAKNSPKINRRLANVQELRSSLEEPAKDSGTILIIESQTRDFLAKTVVVAFFSLLSVIIIGTPIYNALVTNDLSLSDLIQQYGSILGPILGFVIGYYFKSKE